MKRFTLILLGGFALAGFIILYACSSSAFNKQLEEIDSTGVRYGINVMPAAGLPGSYLVSPRFERIERVVLREMSPQGPGSPGTAIELSPEEWTYSPKTDILTPKQAPDDQRYLVWVYGKREEPTVFVYQSDILPETVRLAMDGRIAVRDRDFRLGDDGRSVIIPGLGADYFLRFATKDGGGIACGDASPEHITRALARYLDLPQTGNLQAIPGKPGHYRHAGPPLDSLWLVQLLPLQENDTGFTLRPDDYRFDPGTQELMLAAPRDPARWEPYVQGHADPRLGDVPAEPVSSDGRRFIPLARLESLRSLSLEGLAGSNAGTLRELPAGQWSFDQANQAIELVEAIDPAIWNVRAIGRLSKPAVYRHARAIDPDSIRMVYAGRACVAGKDWLFDAAANTLTITIPGFEPNGPTPYLLHFRAKGEQENAGHSFGNWGLGSLHTLAPSVVRYLGHAAGLLWPPVAGKPGAYRNPIAATQAFASLRVVELAATADGKSGKILPESEYRFDRNTQTIELREPVPDTDFVVQAWGSR